MEAKMRKYIFAAVCVMLISCLAACGEDTPEQTIPLASGAVIVTTDSKLPTVDPDIYGRVTRISHSAEGTELLVERQVKEDDASVYERVVVSIDDNTVLGNDLSDTSTLTMTPKSLSAGDFVEVWFSSDPTTDGSYHFAFGQAVKVITKDAGINEYGITNLPRLVVTGGKSHLAVVTKVFWDGISQGSSTVSELLANNIGASLSASSGDSLSFSFSMPPDSFTVSYGTSTFSVPEPLEVVDGRVIIPQTSNQTIYIFVSAIWGSNEVRYAVAVQLISK